MARKKVALSKEDMLISQRAAQRLVGDPEIISAFEEVRDAYIAIWEKTLPAESEKRELAYRNYKAVSDVLATLQRRANSAHVRDIKESQDKPNG